MLVVLLVLFGFFGLLHREIQCPIEESNWVFLLCTARICSVIWYGAAAGNDVPMARIAGPDLQDWRRSMARRIFVTLTQKYELNREDDKTVGED